MKDISGIYIITCIINNKHYIGRSIGISNRLRKHKEALKRRKHYNIHLQNSWNLYGEESFIFDILEEWSHEFLCSMENYWVNLLGANNPLYGYNTEPTSPFGQISRSEEVKQKIRDKLTGRKYTKERAEKMKYNFLGRTHTEDTKILMSKASKGKKKSKEHIKNMSLAMKGKVSPTKGSKKSEECRRKLSISSTDIYVLYNDTVYSATDFCKIVNINVHKIYYKYKGKNRWAEIEKIYGCKIFKRNE